MSTMRVTFAACAITIALGACRDRTATPTTQPHETLPGAPSTVRARFDATPEASTADASRSTAVIGFANWTRLHAMSIDMGGGNEWTIMADGHALVVTLAGGLGVPPSAPVEVPVPAATMTRLNALLGDAALARELSDTHCENAGRITDVRAQIAIDAPQGGVDREVANCLYAEHPSPPIASLFEILRTLRPSPPPTPPHPARGR